MNLMTDTGDVVPFAHGKSVAVLEFKRVGYHEAQGDVLVRCEFDMYEDYYTSQTGNGMPIFAGARYQRGHGLGSMLSGLFSRIILPFFKANGRMMATKAIKTGLRVEDETQVKILSAIMFVIKVKLSPSVFLAHAKALENTTAKYPIRHVMCKTITIPNDFRDVSHEKLFSGQLPTRLVIAMVGNAAYNSAFDRNPFNFEHFNLMEISVYSAVRYKTAGDRLRQSTLRTSLQHSVTRVTP